MSGFTAGLAVIGGLVLAALVAWNAWTTRRNTPRQPEAVAPAEVPPNSRIDPVFDPKVGGTVTGTYALSNLTDCGLLGGFISSLAAGGGNTVNAKLTPKA